MIELETNVFWDNTKPYQLQSTEARNYVSNLKENSANEVVESETNSINTRDKITSWHNGIIKYSETIEYLYDINSNAFMAIKGLKNLVENYE